jgi:hypothetical protein
VFGTDNLDEQKPSAGIADGEVASRIMGVY